VVYWRPRGEYKPNCAFTCGFCGAAGVVGKPSLSWGFEPNQGGVWGALQCASPWCMSRRCRVVALAAAGTAYVRFSSRGAKPLSRQGENQAGAMTLASPRCAVWASHAVYPLSLSPDLMTVSPGRGFVAQLVGDGDGDGELRSVRVKTTGGVVCQVRASFPMHSTHTAFALDLDGRSCLTHHLWGL